MLTDIRSTFKHSFIYSLGNLATKIVGLILIPIYTNETYLTTTDYGVFGIMEVLSQILVAVMGFSIYSGFNRWYWDKNHAHLQKPLYFTSTIAVLVVSMVLFIAGLLSAGQISQILFQTTDYKLLISIVFLASFIQANFILPLSLMKLQSKSKLFSLINIIKLTITLLSTIYFVVILKKGIVGIYLGQIIGGSITFVLTLKYIFKNIQVHFVKNVAREMFNYSFPLMFTSIMASLLSAFDRFSLNYLSTLENVGIYSLGFKLANTIKVFITSSVVMALNPIRLKKINDPNNGRFYSKILTYFSFGLMIVVLAFSLFSYEIIEVFSSSDKYLPASSIVPFIALGLFFGMMKDNVNIGLIIKKKTKIIGSITLFTVVINLILNILMIPVWGIIGAASSTLLSQIIFFIVIYYFAQKQYRVPYEIRKIIIILITGGGLYGISLLFNIDNMLLRVFFKLFLILCYPFVLHLFKFYDPIELETIKKIWVEWRNPLKLRKNISKLRSKN